jgi:hypothetical protein
MSDFLLSYQFTQLQLMSLRLFAVYIVLSLLTSVYVTLHQENGTWEFNSDAK